MHANHMRSRLHEHKYRQTYTCTHVHIHALFRLHVTKQDVQKKEPVKVDFANYLDDDIKMNVCVFLLLSNIVSLSLSVCI